jgi:hypothetical protein
MGLKTSFRTEFWLADIDDFENYMISMSKPSKNSPEVSKFFLFHLCDARTSFSYLIYILRMQKGVLLYLQLLSKYAGRNYIQS